MTLATGRYRILDKLGEGGMGFVYRAHDANLDTEVVIKVPRPSMLEDPEFAGRFAREIRSLVKLSHPHIVKITDVGEHEGLPFAVMQFLPGGSLRDRAEKNSDGNDRGWLPPEGLLLWLESVAFALDFIHGQKYIHRDIKPDNILFDAHGNVFVSDFGIAKALGDQGGTGVGAHTSTGMLVGTPHYMAPELVMGLPYDGKVDQYALAVTVYVLLCGQFPYDGPTPAAIIVQQSSIAAPLLTSMMPSLSTPLASAVHKALERDPDQRYVNCAAFAQAVIDTLPGAKSTRLSIGIGEKSPTTFATRQTSATEVTSMHSVACPACGNSLRLPSTVIGKSGKCPSCQGSFQVVGKANGPGFELRPAADAPVGLMATQIDPLAMRRPAPSAKPAAASGNGQMPTTAVAAVQPTTPTVPNQLPRPQPPRSKVPMVLGGMLVLAIGVVAIFIWRPWGKKEQDAASSGAESKSVSKIIEPKVTSPLTNTALVGEIGSFNQHTDAVWSVAVSADSKYALSGSADKTVRFWDLNSLKELHRLEGHPSPVFSVSMALPRGVSGSADETVRVWDLATSFPVQKLGGRLKPVHGVAMSQDGKLVLSGSDDGVVRLWDVETGKEKKMEGHEGPVWCVAFLPGNQRCISGGSDRSVRLWDLSSGKMLKKFDGHDDFVWGVAVSADGHQALSGSKDKTIRLWNLDTGASMRTYVGHQDGVYSVAFAKDGQRFLSGSADKTVRLWNLDSGNELYAFKGHTGAVHSVAAVPDGLRVVSASADKTVRIWGLPK